MRLVEGLDGIADTASDVIDMLVFERIRLHEDMIQPLMDIHRITAKQLEIFINVLVQLVSKYDFDKMLASISKIEELESEVDTIEKRLIKVLKGIAEYSDMTVGQMLEDIILHSFEGHCAFGPKSLKKIKDLKAVYDLDYRIHDCYRFKDKSS